MTFRKKARNNLMAAEIIYYYDTYSGTLHGAKNNDKFTLLCNFNNCSSTFFKRTDSFLQIYVNVRLFPFQQRDTRSLNVLLNQRRVKFAYREPFAF